MPVYAVERPTGLTPQMDGQVLSDRRTFHGLAARDGVRVVDSLRFPRSRS